MDSRRISAALGFTLLIACIVGIVLLIHNSGTSRRSTFQNPRRTGDHPHIISSRNENRNSPKKKDGFVNDANYHPEQPTMQEVNELADELHRFLSNSKSKHVQGKAAPSSVNGSMVTKPIMKNVMPTLLPVNHSSSNSHKISPSSPSSTHFQSATSSGTTKKASISVINYSSVPNGNNNNRPYRGPPSSLPSPSSSTTKQHHYHQHKEQQQQQQQQQSQFHHSQHQPYPGHPSPPEKSQADVEPGGLHVGRGGLQKPNDLYTASWHPSISQLGIRNGTSSPSSSSSPNTANKSKNRAHLYALQQQQHHNPHYPPVGQIPNNNNHNHNDISNHKGKMNENGGSSENRYNNGRKEKQEVLQLHHRLHDSGDLYRHHYLTSKVSLNHTPDKEDEGEEEEEEDEEEEYEYEDDDFGPDVSEEKLEHRRGNNLRRQENADLYQQKSSSSSSSDHRDHLNDYEEEEEDDQEDDEDPEPKNFVAELETFFELANHLYTSGIANLSSSSLSSAPVFQSFLKVINETIERSNKSRLLVDLNEKYGVNSNQSAVKPLTSNSIAETEKNGTTASHLQMRKDSSGNSYENSLAAFIFMSFGVFLLNQIHSFAQKSAASSHANYTSDPSGRSYFEPTGFDWLLNPDDSVPTFVGREASSLDILFDPPGPKAEKGVEKKGFGENPSNATTSSSKKDHLDSTSSPSSPHHTHLDKEEDEWSSRASSGPQDIFSSFSSGHHVNNMFRAMLNIVNAYTKDTKALECIWSLYCQDLDATAGKQGLYGVAARINSVGLRLIMNQISPSLTLDVILRSLVGWDGLPCRKMFPDCAVGNGTIAMVSNTTTDGADVQVAQSKLQ